jgi:hypothetical protein
MNNGEKDSKQKDGKKINEDFERKIFGLYDPKLKAKLTNKELPPIETPSKKTDATIRSLEPPTGDRSGLNQASNSAKNETPIDSSDSWEVPEKSKHAIADN